MYINGLFRAIFPLKVGFTSAYKTFQFPGKMCEINHKNTGKMCNPLPKIAGKM